MLISLRLPQVKSQYIETDIACGDVSSRCGSGSTMSMTDDYGTQVVRRPVSSSDFEVIRPVQREQVVPPQGELVIGRHTDTGRLYAIKVFRKVSIGADQRDYTYARMEQAVLRLLTERVVPCAMHLYWSFQDERALYLIMVRLPDRCWLSY